MLALARALERRGDLPGAIDLCQRVLRTEPGRGEAALRLGNLWTRLGDAGRAKPWFERALAIDPDSAEAAGALRDFAKMDALTPDYIRTLFDQYVDRFDVELLGTLGYAAPQLVAAALVRCGVRRKSETILDLGCGTGLSGMALWPFATTLDGVDLSPRMAEKADTRDIYETLSVGDAVEFLEGTFRSWSIIAAVDTLNYIGDLHPVLAASAQRLESNGLFAGTVEKRDAGGVALTEKRRYAHSQDHVEAAAKAAGFSIVDMSEGTLRTEARVPVIGLVFVLKRG